MSLKKRYKETIQPKLLKDLSLSNIHQVPKVQKVTLNRGLGEAAQNAKSLEASLAVGERSNFKEPLLLDEWVLWLKQLPYQAGRTTIVIRKWAQTESEPQELTASPINVRSRVHTYGGGAFAGVLDDSNLVLTWIDDHDGCLWSQVFRDKDNNVVEGNPDRIKTVTDQWKFSKKVSSNSPNWYLAEILPK